MVFSKWLCFHELGIVPQFLPQNVHEEQQDNEREYQERLERFGKISIIHDNKRNPSHIFQYNNHLSDDFYGTRFKLKTSKHIKRFYFFYKKWVINRKLYKTS